MSVIAYSNRVSAEFIMRLKDITDNIGIDPSWLMACMAFETGRTFSATIKNAAGSGAVGLIQFMPGTAAALGTSTEELLKMSPEAQLNVVWKYFMPWRKRLHSLGDTYGAIIWPGMIGKSDDEIIFRKDDALHPKRYVQNRGLDYNKDGLITRGEIVARVQSELERGIQEAST